MVPLSLGIALPRGLSPMPWIDLMPGYSDCTIGPFGLAGPFMVFICVDDGDFFCALRRLGVYGEGFPVASCLFFLLISFLYPR